mgnify:CR=1 FL=1
MERTEERLEPFLFARSPFLPERPEPTAATSPSDAPSSLAWVEEDAPAPWLAPLIQALQVDAQGHAEAAQALRDQAFEAGRGPGFRRHGKPEIAQQRKRLGMRFRQLEAAHFADRIGEERQRPSTRDRRIELAQRTGRAVARIGQQLLVRVERPRIPGLEGLARHVDLAAHLQHRRWRVYCRGLRYHAAQR